VQLVTEVEPRKEQKLLTVRAYIRLVIFEYRWAVSQREYRSATSALSFLPESMGGRRSKHPASQVVNSSNREPRVIAALLHPPEAAPCSVILFLIACGLPYSTGKSLFSVFVTLTVVIPIGPASSADLSVLMKVRFTRNELKWRVGAASSITSPT
jgi:hypothetical protein